MVQCREPWLRPIPLTARPDGLPSGEFRERRDIRDIPTRVDRLFDRITFTSGMVVLLLLLLVGYFLLLRSRLAFQSQGMGFFTRAVWNTANGKPALGVLGLLVGTIVVAVIAIAVALPLAVCAALFITEYAPPRWQRTLTSFIDLFAAIPSLIYGLWGVVVLAPRVGLALGLDHQALRLGAVPLGAPRRRPLAIVLHRRPRRGAHVPPDHRLGGARGLRPVPRG